MTTLKKPLLALIFCIPLAACGSSWEDRALSGGGIGAGAGAVGAAAVLGGAAGAAIGGLTDEDDIDLDN